MFLPNRTQRNRKGKKVSWVLQTLFLVPKPHQKWRPVHRPQQAQCFSPSRKVQDGNTRVHQGLSGSRDVGFINTPLRHLSPYPNPPNLKKVPLAPPQVSNLSVHLSAFPPSHGPSDVYTDSKGGEAYGPLQKN